MIVYRKVLAIFLSRNASKDLRLLWQEMFFKRYKEVQKRKQTLKADKTRKVYQVKVDTSAPNCTQNITTKKFMDSEKPQIN